MKKIYIASDHAGYKLKGSIISKIKKIVDLGPKSNDSVDYPYFAKKLSRKVASNRGSFGILICGSGMGMAIAANKTKNIRAALCYSAKNTKLSRLHNNANIITLGERFINKNKAIGLIKIFLTLLKCLPPSNLVLKNILIRLIALFFLINLSPNVMMFALLCNLDNLVFFLL